LTKAIYEAAVVFSGFSEIRVGADGHHACVPIAPGVGAAVEDADFLGVGGGGKGDAPDLAVAADEVDVGVGGGGFHHADGNVVSREAEEVNGLESRVSRWWIGW